ncbi:unnamed protein product [Rhodiola kirilowii]
MKYKVTQQFEVRKKKLWPTLTLPNFKSCRANSYSYKKKNQNQTTAHSQISDLAESVTHVLHLCQKLVNLQKTVQDLKSKVDISEKSKKTAAGVLEYDPVKEQLEEAEEAIEKLFGVNKRLTRSVEDASASPKSITENSSDESVIVRRRRVLEQIRRASEKISRVNFEVQKLQFLLVKLEGEKEEIVKIRIIPRSPRVRLRDYLYGGSRPVFAHKQKRRQFCGCIRPPTRGD